VLSYSNWETGAICNSESFESLSAGLQKALWELGGVPREHRSDRMSAAVNNLTDRKEFTQACESLLAHYGVEGQKIQAGTGLAAAAGAGARNNAAAEAACESGQPDPDSSE